MTWKSPTTRSWKNRKEQPSPAPKSPRGRAVDVAVEDAAARETVVRVANDVPALHRGAKRTLLNPDRWTKTTTIWKKTTAT
ncbi:MAG TPA: hypothetical protein VG457_04835 [Planctomycetota bacterium]|nr:hypothetical protein [Planctomycetota bacterium]